MWERKSLETFWGLFGRVYNVSRFPSLLCTLFSQPLQLSVSRSVNLLSAASLHPHRCTHIIKTNETPHNTASPSTPTRQPFMPRSLAIHIKTLPPKSLTLQPAVEMENPDLSPPWYRGRPHKARVQLWIKQKPLFTPYWRVQWRLHHP